MRWGARDAGAPALSVRLRPVRTGRVRESGRTTKRVGNAMRLAPFGDDWNARGGRQCFAARCRLRVKAAFGSGREPTAPTALPAWHRPVDSNVTNDPRAKRTSPLSPARTVGTECASASRDCEIRSKRGGERQGHRSSCHRVTGASATAGTAGTSRKSAETPLPRSEFCSATHDPVPQLPAVPQLRMCYFLKK